MNFDLTMFGVIAALAAWAGSIWYARYSENQSKRVWAAYHRWLKTGEDF